MNIEFADEVFDSDADTFTVTQFIREFGLELRIRDLTPKTIKCYLERLGYFRRFLVLTHQKFPDCTRTVIKQYVLFLKTRNLSNITINGYLKVLNIFFSYLISEKLWKGDSNPMDGVRYLPLPKLEKEILSPDDMRRILAVPNRRKFLGLRTYCMLLVFYDTAVRLEELINIRLQDVSLQQGTVRIMGKGRKERVCTFGLLTMKWIGRYLHQHRQHLAGDYLFCTRQGHRLCETTIQRTLRGIAKRTGVPRLSPHLIRHSAATHRARAGMPAFMLQRFLGHSSIQTTQRYVHLGSQADDLDVFRQYSPLDGLLKP